MGPVTTGLLIWLISFLTEGSKFKFPKINRQRTTNIFLRKAVLFANSWRQLLRANKLIKTTGYGIMQIWQKSGKDVNDPI